MQTQILRRSCDSPKCDTEIDLPFGNLRPEHEAALSGWIVMTKEHVLVSGQAPQPLTKLACCSTCAIEVIKNGGLELPKLPPIPEKIHKVPAAN